MTMNEPGENKITVHLDKNKIKDSIAKNGKFEEEGVLIKKWEGEDTEKYVCQIEKGGTKFIGVINGLFERDGYGLYESGKGDRYFGTFKYDQRNFNGIYFWPSVQQGNRVITESYYGFWKNNKKEKNGAYMWLNEPSGNNNFDDADFDIYVGEFENNNYTRGTFLQKKGDNYYVYHGNFKDGKKNDTSGFFYSSNLDSLYFGSVVDDIFNYGYVAFFDSDTGNITNISLCQLDEQSKVLALSRQKELKPEDVQYQNQLLSLFRNTIMRIDYFGEIYKKYKDIIKFIEEEMKNTDIYDDNDKFSNLMKLAAAHYTNNIYIDIELNVFGRKI